MNANFELLCLGIFGKKKFELFKFLCENADENGFVFVKIADLVQILHISKPTIIATFNFLEEKKLLIKLKNGLYQLKLGANDDT